MLMPDVKCVLIHDNFQNFKSYNIPKAQLVIADIPYNIGTDFYASRPDWYVDGDNKNGESSKARKAAFNTDFTFNIAEYFHFCNRLLKKEPGTGEKDAPCMIVFCAFQQIPKVITEAEKYGFKNYIPLVFCKNYDCTDFHPDDLQHHLDCHLHGGFFCAEYDPYHGDDRVDCDFDRNFYGHERHQHDNHYGLERHLQHHQAAAGCVQVSV